MVAESNYFEPQGKILWADELKTLQTLAQAETVSDDKSKEVNLSPHISD